MKKFYLALILTLFIGNLNAQVVDDFESYNLTDYIGAQTNWSTWSGTPAGADDILVSTTTNAASMPTNALHFVSAAGGPADILLLMGNTFSTGDLTIDFDFKNDAGKSGYINIQNTTTAGSWHSNLFFNADGTLDVTDGLNAPVQEGTYTSGSWNTVQLVGSLNTNSWELFINSSSQGIFQSNELSAAMMNFYPVAGDGYWVDNISVLHQPYVAPNLNAAISRIDVAGLATAQRAPKMSLRNLGMSPITSFDLDFTANGGTPMTYNSGAVNIAPNAVYEFEMSQSVTLVAGLNTFKAEIVDVNGMGLDDYAADDIKEFTWNAIAPAPGKLVVGEEATGTWCGWCPRGDIALKTMEEKYYGFFQGIAIHNGDPMADSLYDVGKNPYMSGYPSGLLDRGADIDPSDFEADFLTRVIVPPVGSIQNGAIYDANTGNLDVALNTQFLSGVTGNYKLACVIIEDSVTGTSAGYAQANYYAGGGSGVMGGYENLPGTVPASQMIYRHVARAIAPSFTGIQNAFPSPVNTGATYTHNFNFNVSSYDSDKIHIIGLLIAPNGRIDNASSTTIQEAVNNGFTVDVQDESIKASAISLYPNPAESELNLLLQGIDEASDARINVYSLSGKIVHSQNLRLAQGANTSKVSISALAAGNYILQIKTTAGATYHTTFSKK